MAEQNNVPLSEKTPDFRVSTTQVAAGLIDADTLLKTSNWFVATALDVLAQGIQLIGAVAGKTAAMIIRVFAKGIESLDPAFGEIAKAGLQALFGVDVNAGSFSRLSDSGSREELKRDVGKAMLQVLVGKDIARGEGQLEPTTEPAEAYLGTIANFAIEGWLMEMIAEVESLGYLESFGHLKDTIAEMFGFGRLTRRIMNPFINAAIVEPARWKINKTYRPELLGVGETIRQMTRGHWTDERGREELARQGWSDARIDAMINAAAKFHSAADLDVFEEFGIITHEEAIQHLRDQGYAEMVAADELLVLELKREAAHSMSLANDAVDAFVAGKISEHELDDFIIDAGVPNRELKRMHDRAHTRMKLRRRELTPGEVEDCIEASVLAFPDYREALRREGFTEHAIIAKELLLRKKLDKQRSIAEHRAALEAERATERTAKAERAAERLADVEADRARRRRGSFADLKRAFVRGLIPSSRLVEVLEADYDGDTVAILLEDAETDRVTYQTQQARAAEARQRAERHAVPLSTLEAGVLAGVLTLDQYAARLEAEPLADDDKLILVETLAARLGDRQRAVSSRNGAARIADGRGIDLSRFEQLVRRGARTLEQYTALLEEMGFDAAAVADMRELLALKIGDDNAAAGLRADAAANPPTIGLTLEQFRRAVILGQQTDQAFQLFLVDRNYTSDAQALLLAELRDDVAEAETARARRRETADGDGQHRIALSTVRRAVQLGVIAVDTYRSRLLDEGYSPDDIAIELQLLLTEIADVRAAKQVGHDADRAAAGKGIALADLARAVRRGLRSLEDYRSRAVEMGLSIDAVATLTRILADELRETTAAAARRKAIDSELAQQNLSLDALEQKVRAGVWTIDAFVDALEQTGYATEDAELLAFLLEDELEAVTVPGGTS